MQIVDVTGGSTVSVCFDYGGGNRRGPFVLWTGSGAGAKVKYANILQQMGTIDSGFTYYGRVGTLEFQTQDDSHHIQVTARTLNGNYSKTFPGLNLVDAETADTSRVMLIQNYANNSTYRSTCGFFNPTADAVTVEFTLLNAQRRPDRHPVQQDVRRLRFPGLHPLQRSGRALSGEFLRQCHPAGAADLGNGPGDLFRRFGQQRLERPGGPPGGAGAINII